MYKYSRSDDATRESLEGLPSEEIDRRLVQLLDLVGYHLLPNTMRAYKLAPPPPEVCAKSSTILILYLIVVVVQP
jgi:hypothetical protein